MTTFDSASFFYGCFFAILAQFMLMALVAIFLRHMLNEIISECKKAEDWCDRVEQATSRADDCLSKIPAMISKYESSHRLVL